MPSMLQTLALFATIAQSSHDGHEKKRLCPCILPPLSILFMVHCGPFSLGTITPLEEPKHEY